MRAFLLTSCIAALIIAGLPNAPAVADETGMASIHSWRKVGRKTCLVDHEHSGSGTGATRKAAEASAISSWIGFTAWEYGSSWASYANAIGKKVTCSGGGNSFQCDLLATACRPY
jgi:hypothetical protein